MERTEEEKGGEDVGKRQERLRQTVTILRKITGELGIPYETEEVQALKARLGQFVKDGEPWEGKIPFTPWNRVAHVILSRSGLIEVTLQVDRSLTARQKRKHAQ